MHYHSPQISRKFLKEMAQPLTNEGTGKTLYSKEDIDAMPENARRRRPGASGDYDDGEGGEIGFRSIVPSSLGKGHELPQWPQVQQQPQDAAAAAAAAGGLSHGGSLEAAAADAMETTVEELTVLSQVEAEYASRGAAAAAAAIGSDDDADDLNMDRSEIVVGSKRKATAATSSSSSSSVFAATGLGEAGFSSRLATSHVIDARSRDSGGSGGSARSSSLIQEGGDDIDAILASLNSTADAP